MTLVRFGGLHPRSLVLFDMSHSQACFEQVESEISKDDEVIAESPSLADKVALRTSDYSVEELADELASVILGGDADEDDDLAS